MIVGTEEWAHLPELAFLTVEPLHHTQSHQCQSNASLTSFALSSGSESNRDVHCCRIFWQSNASEMCVWKKEIIIRCIKIYWSSSTKNLMNVLWSKNKCCEFAQAFPHPGCFFVLWMVRKGRGANGDKGLPCVVKSPIPSMLQIAQQRFVEWIMNDKLSEYF